MQVRQFEIDFLSSVSERIFSQPNQKFANTGCNGANRIQGARRKTAARRGGFFFKDNFRLFRFVMISKRKTKWFNTITKKNSYCTTKQNQIYKLRKIHYVVVRFFISPPQAIFFLRSYSCTLYSVIRYSISERASEFFPSTSPDGRKKINFELP